MESQEYSVGLDIGTTKIVAIVGRRNQYGKIEVMGVGVAPSLGVHKGIVNNIAQTINSIKTAVSEAQKSAGVPITKVTVGIAGKHIRSLQHSDYIMRENPDQYITEEDIEELKNQVKKLVMLPGEEIIHVLPQEYKVDSEGEIQEPIGMHGKRLEANFHVVVGQMSSIKNISRCVKEAGLEMESLTLEPLASSEAVLTKEEKEAGVAIVDIGGGTTDIAIFKDNIIRHTCVIPYGGGIITEDIKDGCSIIEKHAEQLKVRFGSAVPELEKESTFVTIPGLHGRTEKEISLKTLAKIIHARVEEILEMVNTELKAYGAHEKKRKLIAGIVLTGGGSNLKHLRQLANYITGFDSRIGYANEYISNDKNQHLKSPEFATSIGLLMESLSIRDKKTNSLVQEEVSVSSQTVSDETNQEDKILDSDKPTHNETVVQQNASKKPTIGQNILEKIKKFFEESE
ncbi:cell division protein FtsA [Riemerella anatipestifer]|uniref:Cell division protein FtsA n=3 Tax=Riemerella anatipestifer TaxID=34085 RepID=J9R132_RIEAN|nr:cell division protein FtsA [Riemerella anatipestifer]ADQ82199.1 cell division protein FtsA [Riemerella anatipestifer ATCC 11845 = DSM 15868]ADZ12297.1 FtsA [Riemerella anatipestifer RA-GD]AFD56199.1 cell division protein ftsa [Riemerella anatipestifer ATCC 11845 = DSM 15868]AFR35454.1 Actin-like ATPase involved in cell division [Riemerella anatipestifer RA-CH-1]AGC39880.1 Actin-like ATPase involved in cell division [Riemerella anatipestifer RA-CH-2]